MQLLKNVVLKFPKRLVPREWPDDEPQPTPISYKTLYDTFEQCPEVVSAITAPVTDMLSDGFDLIQLKGAKKRKEQMLAHLEKIDFLPKCFQQLVHGFITGDGYLEYQGLSHQKVASIVNKVVDKMYGERIVNLTKETKFNVRSKILEKINKNIVLPFNIWNIRSDTIKIKVDKHGNPIGYVQEVDSGDRIKFKPDEIIHWKPYDLGKAYGFTPLKSALNDTATLLFAKEYAGKFFENGGVPNFIFTLPKSRGLSDRNYQLLKHEIKEANTKGKWHKSMVFTGEVNIQKINDFNKDMEFAELIKQMTYRIFMCFGTPITVTPLGVGSKAAGREMNEMYWKRISFWQTKYEYLLNNSIFLKHGFKIVFRKTYKIDELREAQIIGILRDRDLISEREARLRIGYLDDKEPGPEPKRPQRDLPRRDLGDRQDARGLGNDVGARLASYKFKDYGYMEVSWDYFKRIVDYFSPFQTAKILYRETENYWELFFSDGTINYKCIVPKSDIDEDEMRLLLVNAIPIVGG